MSDTDQHTRPSSRPSCTSWTTGSGGRPGRSGQELLPCLCRLRFATNGELADHVRAEHTEGAPPGRTTVQRFRPHSPEATSTRKTVPVPH